eukprot:629437-Pyramimonas_sp.AAC.1
MSGRCNPATLELRDGERAPSPRARAVSRRDASAAGHWKWLGDARPMPRPPGRRAQLCDETFAVQNGPAARHSGSHLCDRGLGASPGCNFLTLAWLAWCIRGTLPPWVRWGLPEVFRGLPGLSGPK